MMAWYIDGSVSMGNLDVFATDKALGDYRVCMIDCDDETVSESDHEANARLIKAAPDMLEALGALVWQLDRMDDLPEELEIMVAEAKAAIAQTKGEA
jgi:hypothetical protein